ncbi:MAG: hypothetical protein EZS28_026257 [Streblomastix strix]|uniref:Uncharacterized protein n=1 Tax=Streblomastix strix TaxID=222440 RepID=A0A5J4V5M5_9EUKA|nr:MAG: hypothetical protein EZS28_026257 [Streblomastix strix]
MRILEEIFIPSPPFIIKRESSQDADTALKQQRRSNEQKDLLKALDDNKEMKNELISHISNTSRLPNIQQSPNIGVIVHRHRVASLLEMILFFIARNSDIPAPFILRILLPDFNNRVMSVFRNPQMANQSYIENNIPLLQHVSIEDDNDRTNQYRLAQINEIVGIIRNSQDSLSLASSQIGYQQVTLFFSAFLFHSLIKQPELIVDQFRNARGIDSNEFAGYYQISHISKPQSKSSASSPSIQSTSLSQSNSKVKIQFPPPPPPKNMNQSQQQSPSSINVNLNAGNQNIEQVKDYANHLLGKLDRGKILTNKHLSWIFKLCPDKVTEFNHKNQNEKIIFLGGILNAIIQEAEKQ